jgi:hypothetical protein
MCIMGMGVDMTTATIITIIDPVFEQAVLPGLKTTFQKM